MLICTFVLFSESKIRFTVHYVDNLWSQLLLCFCFFFFSPSFSGESKMKLCCSWILYSNYCFTGEELYHLSCLWDYFCEGTILCLWKNFRGQNCGMICVCVGFSLCHSVHACMHVCVCVCFCLIGEFFFLAILAISVIKEKKLWSVSTVSSL